MAMSKMICLVLFVNTDLGVRANRRGSGWKWDGSVWDGADIWDEGGNWCSTPVDRQISQFSWSNDLVCAGASLSHWQGRNHGWEVERDRGLGPNTGVLAPRARPQVGLGVGVGRPLPLWGFGGITPGKFVKTQMLNPAFWW